MGDVKLAQPKHSAPQTSTLLLNLLRCFCPSLLCTSSLLVSGFLAQQAVVCHGFPPGARFSSCRVWKHFHGARSLRGAGRAEPDSLSEPLPCCLRWQLLGTTGTCIPSHSQWDLHLAQSPSQNRQGDGAMGCCCWRRAAREGGSLHRVYKLGEILTY